MNKVREEYLESNVKRVLMRYLDNEADIEDATFVIMHIIKEGDSIGEDRGATAKQTSRTKNNQKPE